MPLTQNGPPIAWAIRIAFTLFLVLGAADIAHGQVDQVHVPRSERPRKLSEQMTDKYDSQLDEWDSEVLNDATSSQLGSLKAFIVGARELSAEAVAALVSTDFTTAGLNPTELVEVFTDGSLRVERWDREAASSAGGAEYRGVAGAIALFTKLRDTLGTEGEIQIELKQVRVVSAEDSITTSVLMHATGRTSEQVRQQNAKWECRWSYPRVEAGEAPRLLSIALEEYEQVVLQNRRGPLFLDCTESALAGADCFAGQIQQSLRSWLPKITVLNGMSDIGHHGIAVGDVNGDGLEDVYYTDAGGLPNRLFLQQSDGTVVDIGPESGTDWLDYSTGALFIDLDNDGDQDLIIGTRVGILVSENDGAGKFTLRRELPAGVDATSLAAADYDEDGDLDFFVCQYKASNATVLPTPVPLYDARNGERNLLWRNDGDFVFVDATRETGLADETRFSFAAAWEDYDNDGDMDLYVANDFGPNNLYRNDGGTFVDVAAAAAVEDRATGMSISWGDYNHDGQMDAYVGNMFSSAGQRVTYERRFTEVSGSDATSTMRRFARGNTLFANNGDGTFVDVSLESRATMGRWAWASKFVDVNNDGWEDLLVANGFLTNEGTGDL